MLGAGPAIGVQMSVPLEEMEAEASGGAMVARLVGSGGLPAPSTGKMIMICETIAAPSERGHETTKVSEATDVAVVDGLT